MWFSGNCCSDKVFLQWLIPKYDCAKHFPSTGWNAISKNRYINIIELTFLQNEHTDTCSAVIVCARTTFCVFSIFPKHNYLNVREFMKCQLPNPLYSNRIWLLVEIFQIKKIGFNKHFSCRVKIMSNPLWAFADKPRTFARPQNSSIRASIIWTPFSLC